MVNRIKHHSKHVDRRLKFRLIIYFAVSLVLLGIFTWNILTGQLRLDFGILGLLAGIGLGIFTSRMFRTSWNHDAKKVVGNLDRFGILILILYILLELFRNNVVGYFTHNTQVGTVGFALLAGVMLGRVIGTSGSITKVLKQQGLL